MLVVFSLSAVFGRDWLTCIVLRISCALIIVLFSSHLILLSFCQTPCPLMPPPLLSHHLRGRLTAANFNWSLVILKDTLTLNMLTLLASMAYCCGGHAKTTTFL